MVRSSSSNASLGVLAALGAAVSLSLAHKALSSTRNTREKEDYNEFSAAGMKLSRFQAWFLESCSKGVDHIVATIEISGDIPSEDMLERAVDRLKLMDPNLDCAAVCVGPNDYRLQRTQNVCGQVQVVQDEDWKGVAHTCLNEVHFCKPIQDDEPVPTWKVKLVSSEQSSCGALILVLSHVMFDGTSRNRLIRALLEQLDSDNAATMCTDDEVVPIVSAREIDQHKRNVSWNQFLQKCLRDMVFQFRTRRIPASIMDLSTAPGLVQGDITRETRQLLAHLSQEDTSALIQRCKQEKTTVHGALSSAALIAQQGNPGSITTLGLSHLLSLWNHLADFIPERSLTGCYISIWRTNTVVNSIQPWKIARDVKSELLQDYARYPWTFLHYGYKRTFDGLLHKIFGNAELPPEYNQLQLRPTLSISNNGRANILCEISLPGGKSMKVEGVYATSARHATPGGLAVLNVQTIPGSKLCITLSYYSHVWNDKTAHEFLDRFRQNLKDMARM
jgi:hypothetical protein